MVIAAVSVIYAIASNRGKARKEEQDDLVKRIEKVESARDSDHNVHRSAFEEIRARCQRVEDAIQHVPSHQELHQMALQVERLGGEIGRLAEGLKPLSASVTRIDDFLMSQGKGGQQ